MKLTEKQKNCPYCRIKGADHHIAMIYDAPKKMIGLQPKKTAFTSLLLLAGMKI